MLYHASLDPQNLALTIAVDKHIGRRGIGLFAFAYEIDRHAGPFMRAKLPTR